MKKYSLLSLALIICLMLSSCGAAITHNEMQAADDFKYYAFDGAEAPKIEAETAYGSINYSNSVTTDSVPEVVYSEEKLVYTSRVTLETENFDEANKALHDTISALGGIIVNENASNLNSVNHSGYRSLNMVVRIPQENYNTFLAGLSESYNVVSVNNTVENMTEYYYDSESRLKSYRIQEERLFAMLEKAATVEEMLKIETRLCDVQYEIEALTNTLRTIDNDVKYATFHLNLNEVTKYTSPTPKTFGDRLGDTLRGSGESFADFAEGLLFGLIYFIPYAVIIAVIAAIIVVTVKRSNKKRKSAATEVEKNEK